MTGDRHDHFVRDRRDLQRARNHRDLDVRVVRRGRGEVRIRHGHRVGADIGALCGRLCVVLRNTGERDRAVIIAHRISADALLVAVVDLRRAVTGDLDLVLVRVRRDLEFAVRDAERHVEVVVVVLELALGKAHRVRADIGALRNRFAAEREVRFRVQRAADRDRVAGDLLLIAVVDLAVLVTGDRHRDRKLRDRQRAVGGRDQVVADCLLRAGRYRYAVNRRNHVRLRADVCDRAVLGHDDRKLVRIALCKACHREFRLRQRFAVICSACILRRDRDLRRFDLQPTVRNGDAVLVGCVEDNTSIFCNGDSEVSRLQSHRVRVDIGSLGFRLAAVLECNRDAIGCFDFFACELVDDRKALHILLAAVVRLRIGVAHDLNGELRLPDRIQEVVRILFIRRNPCYHRTGITIGMILGTVIVEEVDRCTSIGSRSFLALGSDLVPTTEHIAITRRCVGDIYSLVDLKRGIRIFAHAVPTNDAAVVVIPDDVRRLGFLNGFEDCPQLDRVGRSVDDDDLIAIPIERILRYAVIIHIGLVMPPGNDAVRIALENREERACFYRLAAFGRLV